MNKILYIFIWLCLSFPMEQSLRIPKYVLLVILFINVLMIKFFNTSTSSSKYTINKYIAGYLFLIVTFVIYGMMNNADDFLNQFEAYFIFPAIYYFTFRNSNFNHKNISRVIHFSLVTIIAQGILIYLGTVFLNISTDFDGLDIPFLSSKYVYNPTNKEFSFPGLNSLPYLIPFSLAYASFRGIKRYRLAFMYLLAILTAYITGRAGIMMVVAIIGGILLMKQFKGFAKPIIFILLTIFLIYFSIFTERIDITERSNFIRFEQFFYLWEEFTNNILIGNGLGTHPEYIRNSVKPSSYELYYLSLLGQLGIIGSVILYFFMYRVVYSARNQRSVWFYSNIYGIFGFLIASLSNPYFDRFDAIFVLFIFL